MILHCVRAARSGGINGLLDHELAYIALRDASPAHVHALMQPDAMTIPARADDDGVARPAQPGPVFSLDEDGCLHMRYTARTRSIEWKADAATRAAVACLEALLAGSVPWILHTRLAPGMGWSGTTCCTSAAVSRTIPRSRGCSTGRATWIAAHCRGRHGDEPGAGLMSMTMR
jgi:hypothetical protein